MSTGGIEPYYGTVLLDAQGAPNPSTLYGAVAQFFANDAGSPFSCTGIQSGSCCYVPYSAAIPGAVISAGDITITDNGSQIGQMLYSNNVYSNVDSVTTSGFAWSAGDNIGISSAGETILAFSGTAIAPPNVAGISPTPNYTTSIDATSASGLTITWTPGSGGSSFFVFLQDKGLNSISCEVPLTSGTLNVPASLLAHLNGSGSIAVRSRTVSNLNGPNANVQVVIRSSNIPGKATF